jgi:hypothetical protein
MDTLLNDYPDAVSIEIRISDNKKYEAAINFYKADFGADNPPVSNAYSASWAYSYPKQPPSVDF